MKHLTPTQWDAVDAGTPDQETRGHLATCEECRAVVAESRALLVGLRRIRHTQESGQPLPTNHPAAEDLAVYGDGVLFDAGARSIEEHLELCSDCRDDIVVMRDIAAAGDLKETVSIEVRDQLLERLSHARRLEQVTSLGGWLVEVSRRVGAMFSPLASGRMAAAAAMTMALKNAEVRHATLMDQKVLEYELDHAREEAEHARMMMDRATARMRDLTVQVEQNARRAAEDAREAADVAAMMRDPVGPLLELTAADVRLRIESSDRARPDVFTVTVITQDGRPAVGVPLEMRSPDGEPTLRTTDEQGQASFSLQRGESRLRLRRHGVWELQLDRH